MPLPLLANTISKIEIQEQVMPIRILPPYPCQPDSGWWRGGGAALLEP